MSVSLLFSGRFDIPAECLQEIFKYYQNEPNYLYTCLQVSKCWCHNAVTLLYRNPFDKIHKPSAKLITTYLQFLNDKTKSSFESRGVRIPHYSRPFIIDYPVYVHTFCYKQSYDSVINFLSEHDVTKRQVWEKELFAKEILDEIFKIFVIRGVNIDNLVLDTEDSNVYPPNVHMLLPRYPSVPSFMRRVKKFTCGGRFEKGDLMCRMSTFCKGLHTLQLNFYDYDMYDPRDGDRTETKRIGTLIEAQLHLQRLIVHGPYRFLSNLLPAVTSQSNCLTHVEFVRVVFRDFVPLFIVAMCSNLQTLIMEDCQNLNDFILSPLATASFTRLKKFVFINQYQKVLDNLVPVVANTLGSLREVRFRRRLPSSAVVRNAPDIPPAVIETIASTSVKLKRFEGHIEQKTMQAFMTLLMSCLTLKRLTISVEHREFFTARVPLLFPRSLRFLTISFAGFLSANELDDFLNHCSAPLETLQLPASCCIDHHHFHVIVKHARRMGTLQRLALSRYANISEKDIEQARGVIKHISMCGEQKEW
ncbi:1386_t:CDS:1 [Paraglomus brasilianum]|uniref:1386_t:CDS:1 n=1 Tax=Paraglomus brasilianum TaxID=144538 RepID=A0A9N8ZI46_9GLOM|nr:1386_t:CDS:1 [Paraglomus brasilianum]